MKPFRNARQTFPSDAGVGLSERGEGRCWSIFVELAMGEVLTGGAVAERRGEATKRTENARSLTFGRVA